MNNNKELIKFSFTTLLVFILAMGAGYTIKEGEQVVITLFGKPVRMVKEAGLHWKWPFVETVRIIDLRMLNWDGYPNQIPTRDKKYITVDTTARWKIIDPLKFIQTVQSQQGAQSRLDAILDATTRDVISSHNLVEAVRNSNAIFDVVSKRAEMKEAEEGQATLEEEVVGDIEKVEIGRENLSKIILDRASKELMPIGIELIDVQIRRIMYEASVQKKVYSRMISERERIAEKIRSIGRGEQAKIEGKTSREVQEIQSLAYRTSQKIKGDAEAKSIAIYARVLNQDPAFYEFTRKLEAYRTSIGPDTRIIMGSGSKFFDVMTNGK
ncbi:MAG: HflC protein [Pseudomonadota bacterium]